MKFERMNEQQIRCTLYKEDLAIHQIKVDELAYGTNKANSLFKDLLLQAEGELDFEVGDSPLMIEAVPVNSDCIVLTISKVDDPEELDTRFAQFAPDLTLEEGDDEEEEEDTFGIAPTPIVASTTPSDDVPEIKLARLFSFSNLDIIIRLSKILAADYTSDSSIYKNAHTNRYYLLIEKGQMDILTFNRICNIVSEYGESEKNLLATSAHLSEHLEVILAHQAINQLSKI